MLLLPVERWLLLLCCLGGIKVSMPRVKSLAWTLPPTRVTIMCNPLLLLLLLLLGRQQRLGSALVCTLPGPL